MKIDITKLKNYQVSVITVNELVDLRAYLNQDYRIDDLKNVTFKGTITINEDDELVLNGDLAGTMLLKDDVTLESVSYDFDTTVEEYITTNEFVINLVDILWQNVLVEIPSKVRKNDEDIEINGNGWRVISEDTFNKERNEMVNPFVNLSELIKTKEDK